MNNMFLKDDTVYLTMRGWDKPGKILYMGYYADFDDGEGGQWYQDHEITHKLPVKWEPVPDDMEFKCTAPNTWMQRKKA